MSEEKSGTSWIRGHADAIGIFIAVATLIGTIAWSNGSLSSKVDIVMDLQRETRADVKALMGVRPMQQQQQAVTIGQPDMEKIIREGRDKIITEYGDAYLRGNSSGLGQHNHVDSVAPVSLRDATGSGGASKDASGRGEDGVGTGVTAAGAVANGEVPAPAAVSVRNSKPVASGEQ